MPRLLGYFTLKLHRRFFCWRWCSRSRLVDTVIIALVKERSWYFCAVFRFKKKTNMCILVQFFNHPNKKQ